MKNKLQLILKYLRQGTLQKMWRQTLWIYQYGRRYWKSMILYTLLGITGSCVSLVSSLISKDLEENGLFSFLANSIFTNSSCCEAEELLAKIFLKLLKECLQETRQKEQAHSQQYDQKLRQQQSLLLEKYLEGLIDESLYKEKQLDLQSKIQKEHS